MRNINKTMFYLILIKISYKKVKTKFTCKPNNNTILLIRRKDMYIFQNRLTIFIKHHGRYSLQRFILPWTLQAFRLLPCRWSIQFLRKQIFQFHDHHQPLRFLGPRQPSRLPSRRDCELLSLARPAPRHPDRR